MVRIRHRRGRAGPGRLGRLGAAGRDGGAAQDRAAACAGPGVQHRAERQAGREGGSRWSRRSARRPASGAAALWRRRLCAFRDDYSLLVHPDPKLVGTNVRETRDAEGKPIFEDLYAQGKAGGGYVDYLFPRPGSDDALPKISYAVYEPEWGWLLFTGLYVDDVDAAFRATLWRQGGVTLGLLAVVLLAALRFFRTHIIRPLDEAVVVRAGGARRSVQYRVASSPGRDRPAVRRHGADAGTSRRGGAQHRAFHGFDRRGLAPNRRRQHGPARPHREAGGGAGADGGQRGADHRHRQAERRPCAK